MGALILILPTLAFDIWLAATVGKRQVRRMLQARPWLHLAGLCAAGVALAVCFLVVVRYNWDPKMRVAGFPSPMSFFSLEDKTWIRSTAPQPWFLLGAVTNALTGMALPFFPYKVAEFFRTVKQELNR
jgi:hypothetical protein